MDLLGPLKASKPPRKELKNPARYAFQLSSERSGQVLVVTSDDPLDAYQLDDPTRCRWPSSVRVPEGVLIGEHDGRDYVVFIELKGTSDPEKGKRGKVVDATEQLESMLSHFHPFGRSGAAREHGDHHHDLWSDGADELDVSPQKNHVVVGLAMYRRAGTLPAPELREVGGREVLIVHAPFHNSKFGRLELSFSELLKHIP